jgi:catechol 2,3-dioxygenase-like lactoylglutathione lyase family enzyme
VQKPDTSAVDLQCGEGFTLGDMTVQLNHTIVYSKDRNASAEFLAEVLGLKAPVAYGPFAVVQVEGVSLDFLSTREKIAAQHYAFLVGEAEFDEIFARVRERNLPYWAGPGHYGEGEINTNDGGRGVYFDDPDGHALEILTVPYGG